jgi:BlaI family transcriptional regulator, penicillinase repressor
LNNIPKLPDSEWEIMKILWKESPLTSECIINRITKKRDWSPPTIKTLINRLLKKEVIGFDKVGRNYHYYPIISEKECVKVENKFFLKRVYDGALGMLFTNYLENEELTKDEIEHIQELLNKKKDEEGID